MLPSDFLNRMKLLLNDEYDEFIECYNNDSYKGIRVNTLKISREDFLKLSPFNILGEIPWEDRGFYINEEKPGKNPYHSAGLYYIQEPSAMAVVPQLNIKKGDYLLDLCAAPGGKSTQAAAYLQGEGLLVSNEIDRKRSKILSENIERMGIKNAIVTNCSPKELEGFFENFFDKIIVDAPCSGEGMFRKEEEALNEWSLSNVLGCSVRQREILESAAKMLKEKGLMVYSTCTFSLEENEMVINSFLKDHREFSVEEAEVYNGFKGGFFDIVKNPDLKGAVRLFPHRIKGEGHFMCLLRKNENVYNVDNYYEGKSRVKNKGDLNFIKREDLKEYLKFEKEFLNIKLNGNFLLKDDKLFLIPDGINSFKGLKLVKMGLELGSYKKDRFEPSHSLAISLKADEIKRKVDIDVNDERVILYLIGNTLKVDMDDGWCVLCIGGHPLGWGKVSKGIMKNHYPKGLRWYNSNYLAGR